MFDDISTRLFYGNSITDWLLTFLLIIVSMILAKAIYWIIGKFVKGLTHKSKNEIDDLIVDTLEKPLVFAIVITGIWYSIQLLNQSDSARTTIETAFYILIIFDATWVISKLFDALVHKYIRPLVENTESQLDDQLLPITTKGIKAAIWITAVLVALDNAGYNINAIIASLGIGGLAFALAAKDTIANLFGSFTIFFDKPFMIGDRVILKDYDGHIREIGIRSTRIQTLDGRTVTIPNSQVADTPIENVSSEPNRKVTVDLGLTYDMDETHMQNAIGILKTIAEENSNIEKDFTAAFTEFNDSSLNIRFIYYIRRGKSVFDTKTMVNMEILRQFNKEGLEFAFPSQTIYRK